MALWPFGKKKNRNKADNDAAAQQVPEHTESAEPTDNTDTADAAAAQAEAAASEAAEPAVAAAPAVQDGGQAAGTAPLTDYDPINGSTGPFDGDSVNIEDFDFSDFSSATLNLHSMRIPFPKEAQVQVEMGEQGPKMVHIVTRYGRVTPVAFAAPRSGGLWDDSAEEIAEGMRNEGMPVTFEQGPWGKEIVGQGTNGVIRIIGVEGPRWLYRVTLAAPQGREDDLAKLGREIVARSFVYRGNDPVLAGSSLDVILPKKIAEQVQQAVQQRAQQGQSAAAGQSAPQSGNPNLLSDALKQIIDQNNQFNKDK